MTKTAFLTGVTGQDGSYLADLLLSKDYEVHALLRRASTNNLSRIEHLLPQLKLHYGDLGDSGSLVRALRKARPEEVYNLGAMSHVGVSFENPEYTVDVTGAGAIRLLEAVRDAAPGARVYQASSSEMFGSTPPPQNESTPFHPRSPYGCSKVFAYWAGVNYRESYGMFVSNGVLFNHECLTEETPIIFRRNGWIDIAEIQELVPHRTDPRSGRKYQTIPNDLEIFDGDGWSRVTCATATWNDGEKEVFRVESRGGMYCATGDHVSFLDGKKETATKNLKPGDSLQLFPPPSGRGDALIAAEEAEFLGLMCGDGYVCPDGGSARFTNLDDDLLSRAARLFHNITGGKYRRDESKKSGFTGETVPSMEFSGASCWFSLWRSEIYNERGMKKVPKRILNAPASVQRAFLVGYNAADGLKSKSQEGGEFRCWVTNSVLLAAGLWLLAESQGLRAAFNWDPRGYVRLNVGEALPNRGAHLLKPLNEIKKISKLEHRGWVFDLATESGTFSAGVGRTWVHNSPRRGENFVTRKITQAVARIHAGRQGSLLLGNLRAKRDWGFAGDFVEAMWLMLQHDTPDDFVIATGEMHTVAEFCEAAFSVVGLDWQEYVRTDPALFRPAEVDALQGDSTKARQILGWQPKVTFKELAKMMVEADIAAL